MTRIGTKTIRQEEDQGSITFHTAGVQRAIFTNAGLFLDANGVTFRGLTGGTSSITAASAATAGSTSALSAFTIAHGLASTPTVFGAQPANTKAALANLLGAYVTADGTNVYYNTASSVTASSAYSFNWWAAP